MIRATRTTNLGRFKLSAATAPAPRLRSPALDLALAKPRPQRTPKEQATVTQAYARTDPAYESLETRLDAARAELDQHRKKSGGVKSHG